MSSGQRKLWYHILRYQSEPNYNYVTGDMNPYAPTNTIQVIVVNPQVVVFATETADGRVWCGEDMKTTAYGEFTPAQLLTEGDNAHACSTLPVPVAIVGYVPLGASAHD